MGADTSWGGAIVQFLKSLVGINPPEKNGFDKLLALTVIEEMKRRKLVVGEQVFAPTIYRVTVAEADYPGLQLNQPTVHAEYRRYAADEVAHDISAVVGKKIGPDAIAIALDPDDSFEPGRMEVESQYSALADDDTDAVVRSTETTADSIVDAFVGQLRAVSLTVGQYTVTPRHFVAQFAPDDLRFWRQYPIIRDAAERLVTSRLVREAEELETMHGPVATSEAEAPQVREEDFDIVYLSDPTRGDGQFSVVSSRYPIVVDDDGEVRTTGPEASDLSSDAIREEFVEALRAGAVTIGGKKLTPNQFTGHMHATDCAHWTHDPAIHRRLTEYVRLAILDAIAEIAHGGVMPQASDLDVDIVQHDDVPMGSFRVETKIGSAVSPKPTAQPPDDDAPPTAVYPQTTGDEAPPDGDADPEADATTGPDASSEVPAAEEGDSSEPEPELTPDVGEGNIVTKVYPGTTDDEAPPGGDADPGTDGATGADAPDAAPAAEETDSSEPQPEPTPDVREDETGTAVYREPTNDQGPSDADVDPETDETTAGPGAPGEEPPVVLEVTDSEAGLDGVTFDVFALPVVVGREGGAAEAGEAYMALPVSTAMSRPHFRLSSGVAGPELQVLPSAKNATRIAGDAIEPGEAIPLTSGVEISVVSITIRFRIPAPPAEQPDSDQEEDRGNEPPPTTATPIEGEPTAPEPPASPDDTADSLTPTFATIVVGDDEYAIKSLPAIVGTRRGEMGDDENYVGIEGAPEFSRRHLMFALKDNWLTVEVCDEAKNDTQIDGADLPRGRARLVEFGSVVSVGKCSIAIEPPPSHHPAEKWVASIAAAASSTNMSRKPIVHLDPESYAHWTSSQQVRRIFDGIVREADVSTHPTGGPTTEVALACDETLRPGEVRLQDAAANDNVMETPVSEQSADEGANLQIARPPACLVIPRPGEGEEQVQIVSVPVVLGSGATEMGTFHQIHVPGATDEKETPHARIEWNGSKYQIALVEGSEAAVALNDQPVVNGRPLELAWSDTITIGEAEIRFEQGSERDGL